ncbi:MAG: carotenoid biosynthesis protein [Bacteroidetes bacterium]|nr:carotenoid biosynthesis protein [Bacteroidota bacterium]
MLINRISILVIIIFHLVGLVGILFFDRAYFISLTPLNLLITLCFFLVAELRSKARLDRNNWLIMSIAIAVLGYLVELIGVKTGSIFGQYQYGETLGAKLLDVPLVIGVNWCLLLIGSASVANKYKNYWVKLFVGASLMVALDLLIEPIAVSFNYWSWAGNTIPIQNYVAWWIVSFILLALVFKMNSYITSKVGEWIYLIQVIFFSLLNLML